MHMTTTSDVVRASSLKLKAKAMFDKASSLKQPAMKQTSH